MALAVLVVLVAACSSGEGGEGGAGATGSTTTTGGAAGSPLLVADVSGLSPADQVTFAALQGLVNRDAAEVWLTGYAPHPGTPVDVADPVLRGIVGRPEQEVSTDDLLTRFADDIEGLVVWDPGLLIDTQNVATSLAGQLDALPVSPRLARRLARAPYDLPVLADLRDERFASRADAYRWALDQLPDGHEWAFPAWIGDSQGAGAGDEPALRDWVVANCGFAFEANVATEGPLVQRILGEFAPGSAVYGYLFYADEAYLAGGAPVLESASVAAISEAGLRLIPTVDSYNLTVLSQTRSDDPMSAWDSRPRTPEPDGRYVTFIVSDGDNVSYDQYHLLTDVWPAREQAGIPIGVTVSLELPRLAPALWDHYVTTAGPDTVLVAAPSGAGYAYPSMMPDLDGYLELTAPLLRDTGLRSIWLLDNGGLASPDPSTTDAYADRLPLDALFADYASFAGGVVTPNPPAISFAGEDEVPVVHGVFGLGVELAVEQIRRTTALAGDGPGFVFVGLNAWEMGPGEARQVMDRLGPGYTAVRPDEFIGLLAGARRDGLLADGLTATSR